MLRHCAVLMLGCVLLHQSAALAQFPLGPGAPGQPPAGQTEPGAPGMPAPPLSPLPPSIVPMSETPGVPYNAPPVPTFAEPKPATAFDGAVPLGNGGPAFICNLGVMVLRRETVGSNQSYAVFDDGVVLPPPFPRFFDHGGPPSPGAPTALSLSDLSPNFGYGFKGSMIFFGESTLFEIAGFYMPGISSRATASAPSRLDLPFANSPPPLGFEGTNASLWLQADQVKLDLESEIGNVEVNVHYPSSGVFDLILGLRFFDLRDKFTIFTDDDGLTIRPVDPTTQASYIVESHSRLLGPQIGLQLRMMLEDPDVVFGVGFKAVPGVNFNEVEIRLERGDGFVGRNAHREKNTFSQLLEFNLGLEFGITERMVVRASYQALMMLNVPVSYDQVNFDPGNTVGTPAEGGMVLFHGPSLMVQF